MAAAHQRETADNQQSRAGFRHDLQCRKSPQALTELPLPDGQIGQVGVQVAIGVPQVTYPKTGLPQGQIAVVDVAVQVEIGF